MRRRGLAIACRAIPGRTRKRPGRLVGAGFHGGVAVLRHVLLEGLDALREVAHQAADLAAAEQQQDDQQHHHPVPDAEATHESSKRAGRVAPSAPPPSPCQSSDQRARCQRDGATASPMQALFPDLRPARPRRAPLWTFSADPATELVATCAATAYRRRSAGNPVPPIRRRASAAGAGSVTVGSVALLYNWTEAFR